MRRIIPWLMVALFAAPAALAQDKQARALAFYKDGRAAMQLKDYDKAIDAFTAALALDPNPVLVFNVARAYEAKGQPAVAIGFYRQYKAMEISPTDKADAQTRIEALELAMAKKQEPEPEPPPPAPVAEPAPMPVSAPEPAPSPAPAPEVIPEPAPEVEDPTPPVTQEEKGLSGMTIAGITTTTVGGLAIVGGLTAFSLCAGGVTCTFREDAGDSDSVSWTLYGIGGAAVVTGIILLVLPDDDQPEDVSLRGGVVPLAGGAGVTFGGSF